MLFQDSLKGILGMRNVSKNKLGRMLHHASPNTIQKMFNNKHAMKLKTALKILDFFDCEMIIRDNVTGLEYHITSDPADIEQTEDND